MKEKSKKIHNEKRNETDRTQNNSTNIISLVFRLFV